MLKGRIIELIPSTLADRRAVYDWCFHCETSKSHSGADFPDIIIPSYEEFCDDYADYFFTGAELHNGRGFLIVHKGETVGFISYCSYHLKPQISELDIWLNSEAHCGKGFGTDAVLTLGDYINQTLEIQKLIMAPAKKNTRAIAAYKKAGFKESDLPMSAYLLDEYIELYGGGDYGEEHTAVLVKQF
jgi:RimJ/RimL family protein N-acetyltransferase